MDPGWRLQSERLPWDPRNCETFYVGKGKKDRIFQHATRVLPASEDEDATDLKYQRIKHIRSQV